MRSEMERLKDWVDFYEFKPDEIRKALVDNRLRMLRSLYRFSEKNKNCGVKITIAGVINPVKLSSLSPRIENT